MTDKYNFQLGERVIKINGRIGEITHVCHCDRCEERGFYEIKIEYGRFGYEGDFDYIDNFDERDGFLEIHKIGNRVFNPLNLEVAEKEKERVQGEIDRLEKKMKDIQKGIDFITSTQQGANAK